MKQRVPKDGDVTLTRHDAELILNLLSNFEATAHIYAKHNMLLPHTLIAIAKQKLQSEGGTEGGE